MSADKRWTQELRKLRRVRRPTFARQCQRPDAHPVPQAVKQELGDKLRLDEYKQSFADEAYDISVSS